MFFPSPKKVEERKTSATTRRQCFFSSTSSFFHTNIHSPLRRKKTNKHKTASEKPITGKRLFKLNDPVKTIALCTPLNVLVKTGDKRSVFVDSGPDAVPVDVAVSPRQELVISTRGSFETSSVPVKIIATVPQGELEGVSISPSGGALVVEGPVEPSSRTFNASSVMGAADLVVNNVKADRSYLASSGASRVFLLNKQFPDAKVGTVHVAAGGTSSAFVFGGEKIDLLLEGGADAAVEFLDRACHGGLRNRQMNSRLRELPEFGGRNEVFELSERERHLRGGPAGEKESGR